VRKALTIFILSAVVLSGCFPSAEDKAAKDLIARLEALAADPQRGDEKSGRELVAAIRLHKGALSRALIAKLSKPELPEVKQSPYAWALAMAADPDAAGPIIGLHRASGSPELKSSYVKALAAIGGQVSGEYLMGLLDAERDPTQRFYLLDALAEMRYAPALERAEEILRIDPHQEMWQAYFVFGKMGDVAVPYLVRQLGADDPNVRLHAAALLGQWLAAPEAESPLKARFLLEPDPMVRGPILSSLECVFADFESMRAFFNEVVARETDSFLHKFAGETVASIDERIARTRAFAAVRKPSAPAFDAQWRLLMDSGGLEGDYVALANASDFENVAKLKQLRERVLQRNSDECFHDYAKVTEIIVMLRCIQTLDRA